MPDLAFLHLDVKDVPAVTLATEPNVLTIGREIATAGFRWQWATHSLQQNHSTYTDAPSRNNQ